MARAKLGPKLRPHQTLLFTMERRNSDHGLSFWRGKLRPWSEFSVFLGRGRQGGAPKCSGADFFDVYAQFCVLTLL